MRLHRSIAPMFTEGKMESPDCMGSSLRNSLVIPLSVNDASNPQEVISSHLVKVADCLFLGSIEAAYDEPLMCRHQISSVVDLSALPPNQVAKNRKSPCPCACSLQVAHCRAKLTVPIQDREHQDISPYLSDINTFIHASRAKRKNVLVFSNRCQSRAPAIVIQYLMQTENASLTRSIVQLTSLRPSIKINKGFLRTLREIERKQTTTVVMANPGRDWMQSNSYRTSESERPARVVIFNEANRVTEIGISGSLKRAWA